MVLSKSNRNEFQINQVLNDQFRSLIICKYKLSLNYQPQVCWGGDFKMQAEYILI